MIVSIATSRSTMMADGTTPILLCARGPSRMLTASTPAFLTVRHCSMSCCGRQPTGGTSSTLTANSRSASFFPQFDRAFKGTGETPAGAVTSLRLTTAVTWRGCIVATRSRIVFTCSGVVPQHPPTNRAPASIIRIA